ncbi:MAG: hypothetical protein JMN25_15815 [gamma proteobacterium endosymbiont of Lamellibrachia anaximandri]|nr:hypothetical protein [gamma proteobacterium endosymbiont of Lamellibrachia anaximandri]
MMRKPDWDKHLLNWFRENENRPFCWGSFDCALAAAEAIEVQTGIDQAADVRGRYTSAKGALTIIKKAGFADLEDLVTDRLGPPLRNPRLAHRGDIVLGKLDNGPTLLVVMGLTAFGPAEDGLQAIPMDRWMKAWRVG